jgi:hypothetical protein
MLRHWEVHGRNIFFFPSGSHGHRPARTSTLMPPRGSGPSAKLLPDPASIFPDYTYPRISWKESMKTIYI